LTDSNAFKITLDSTGRESTVKYQASQVPPTLSTENELSLSVRLVWPKMNAKNNSSRFSSSLKIWKTNAVEYLPPSLAKLILQLIDLPSLASKDSSHRPVAPLEAASIMATTRI
jgi:hypothetical protein